MDVERAAADLAEVRLRLVTLQRFEGISGKAAIASGGVALGTGLLQRSLVPLPATSSGALLYLWLWLGCLGVALAINYGAILSWVAHERRAGARSRVRSAGKTILPAIVVGGVSTASLAVHGLFWLLPGMWCLCYALGLFASKAMLPRPVLGVAGAFAALGSVLVLVPATPHTLAWWIMPLAFGIGQTLIGSAILQRDGEQ